MCLSPRSSGGPQALEREESVSLYEKTAKRHQMTDREGGREGDFEREEDIKKDGLREREGGFRERRVGLER